MLDDYLRLRNQGCHWQPSHIPHRVRELGASSNLETIRISKESLECVVDAPGSDDAAWLIRRFGDGSNPLSISAQGWAAWDLPELTAPRNFTSSSDRLFATAFMFWPVGVRGGPVEYPPIHNHHSAYLPGALADSYPTFLRDFKPARSAAAPGSAADFWSLGKEGRASIIKTLPDGYAYELPAGGSPYSIIVNDVRPTTDARPLQLYYELGLRLLRRPHPRRMPSLVHHLDWFMREDDMPGARSLRSAMYQTFLLPMGRPSIKWREDRWPRGGRVVLSFWHGHHKFTDEAYVFSGSIRAVVEHAAPPTLRTESAVALPPGADMRKLKRGLVERAAAGGATLLCAFTPHRDGEYDRAATGGGAPGRGGAGDCTLTGHRFAAGDTLSVLCFNSAPAEANQRQHCNLATSVAFDAEETMVEERARGRPKYRA